MTSNWVSNQSFLCQTLSVTARASWCGKDSKKTQVLLSITRNYYLPKHRSFYNKICALLHLVLHFYKNYTVSSNNKSTGKKSRITLQKRNIIIMLQVDENLLNVQNTSNENPYTLKKCNKLVKVSQDNKN